KEEVSNKQKPQHAAKVSEYGHTLNAHAECKAGIIFRVNVAVHEHLGVHHASAQELDPALAPAGAAAGAVALEALHVHLAAGHGEGEVVGAEAHHGVSAVELLDHLLQASLEVGHGDALVHHQTLHQIGRAYV